MAHEAHHHHEEKQNLSFFASPLVHSHPTAPTYTPNTPPDLEHQEKPQPNAAITPDDPSSSTPEFENMDCSLHDHPDFHRHAEATTAELFYDLFFVANLTTFTSMLEINDSKSLTAYIGFFSLLWLTWYQVSLYDVRFSADSVFERTAKAIHFGVMVGFAVIGPQWKPGQEIGDYKIYKAFGLMLMVSRLTLFCQYGVTLVYTHKHKKTVVPLAMVMASTLLAAVLYGALTPTFPKTLWGAEGTEVEQKSNVYIAWYVIALSETVLTVVVSCVWRIISFKGTHMVQRMSLLTLIILGEGIIVICKSISKIVKNEYLWSLSVVGQIIAGKSTLLFLKGVGGADRVQRC
jgi:low temperature requirement protein LtrA